MNDSRRQMKTGHYCDCRILELVVEHNADVHRDAGRRQEVNSHISPDFLRYKASS